MGASAEVPKVEERSAADIIAENIEAVSKSARELLSSRLKQETIVTLIHTKSKVPKRDIELVLNNLYMLEETYLKKKIN